MPRVTAIIPVYQPDPAILTRCLACVTPQVDAVILATEGRSILPHGIPTDPRISVAHTPRCGIGFGANVNQGATHAPQSTDWLLILNDDVFLNDDAVARMLETARPDTGIVVHLLRYQDGRIFSTVCARRPGDYDFSHVDHLAPQPTMHTVQEVENACGASWLIRHDVWRRVHGYDESFFAYCEDNDLSMRVRQAGWKILYTPHAKGWHVGHQSMRLVGDLSALIRPSAACFHAKWGDYLAWNRCRVPGNFDYLRQPTTPAYAPVT